ncbi:pentapeptide repeat-containing protein [Marivita hallyeonensis]|nr:pentapeptide repeat-containing protein [Marivita hallyeonensis]
MTGDVAVVRFCYEDNSFVSRAERVVLEWLMDEFDCEMESWAGTNASYWKTSHVQQNVEFMFLPSKAGFRGNSAWTLRVDERGSRLFCKSLAPLFGGFPDPVRTLPDGTLRTHFSSESFEEKALVNNRMRNSEGLHGDFERVLRQELDQREADFIEALKEDYPNFGGSWHHLLALLIATDPSKDGHDVFEDSWNKRALLRKEKEHLNLKGLDFSTVDIQRVSLVDLDLRGCSFDGLDLRDRDLSSNKMEKTSFKSSNLGKTNFSNCNLRDANFEGANLIQSDLSGADLIRARFVDACLNGANLNEARASQCDFSGADLSVVKVLECDFAASNLSKCDFFNSDFSRTNVELVNFEGANLTRVESEIYFDDCKIRGALISPRSKAPLMVLQRTYTGPWFILTFLLAVFALSPFFLEAVFWSVVADAFSAAERVNGATPHLRIPNEAIKGYHTTYVGLIVLGLHDGYFQAFLTVFAYWVQRF